MIIRRLTISIFLFCIWQNVAAQWTELHGTAEGEQMKLYIETRDWPQRLIGFNLKKRSLNGEWALLNPNPVTPQFSADRNWANLGLNQEQINTITTDFQTYVESGKIKPISEDRFLEIMREVEGLKSGDRLRMKNDFQLALMAGFAYVDNSYDPEKDQEYGVFLVDQQRQEEESPLAVYSTAGKSRMALDFSFSRKKEGIQLQWSQSASAIEENGVFGFNLYRAKKGKKNMTLLTPSPLGAKFKNGETRQYHYSDKEADPTEDYTYKLAVVNMFQKETHSLEKDYEARAFESLEIPSIDSIHLVDQINVQLNWELDLKRRASKRITKIRIQRAEASKLNFSTVGEVESDDESWVDKNRLKYGKPYVYRIEIEDDQGNKWHSPTKNFLYMGTLKPPAPVNPQAQFRMINQEPYVVLNWEKQSAQDSVTQGFLLYSDQLEEGEMLYEASIPMIAETEYRYPLNSWGGRSYTFRIEPVNSEGETGPSVEVSCQVNSLRLPRLGVIKASLTENNQVALEWNYPEDAGINGFRVIMNEQMIAGPEEVSAESRTWVVSDPVTKDNGMVDFQVEAVADNGTTRSMPASLYLPGLEKNINLSAPGKLEAETQEENETLYAHLTWEAPEGDNDEISGYILYVDSGEEGVVLKQAAMPLIKATEYKYEIPDTERDQYTFRISAITKDKKEGPYAEVTLEL